MIRPTLRAPRGDGVRGDPQTGTSTTYRSLRIRAGFSAGYAHRCQHGTALISYGVPRIRPAMPVVQPLQQDRVPGADRG